MALPQRLWILGPCGSGKSWVADDLAARLGVAATHLDDIFWNPGWVKSSMDEVAAGIQPIMHRDRWVVDGNYRELRRQFADQIELYVWLDLPLRVTLPRVLARCMRRSLRREPCCNGNFETLRRTFAHRDSLLLWAITSDRPRRAELSDELTTQRHVRLRSQAEIDRWLAEG